MAILSIEVDDKKSVTITMENGRKVKYFYNRLLSEDPDVKKEGVQAELKLKEVAASGN